MKPYCVRRAGNVVEAWSGYRIQFGGMERHSWQKELKVELKEALSQLAIPEQSAISGFYDSTDTRAADVENSLYTNVLESMPPGVMKLRFERGTATPPAPPVPIALIAEHLHYYRYQSDGPWTSWQPDETLATWNRIPRRLPDDLSARPVWFALREANADNVIAVSGNELGNHTTFGLRLVVHATNLGPRNAITYSERLVDGTIAAFHNDRYSESVVSALAPKLRGTTEDELRRALDKPIGPLFATPAIRSKGSFIQFSPADEHCIVGEVAIRRDSSGRWPELSGELFTVRPIASPLQVSDVTRQIRKPPETSAPWSAR